MLDMVGVSGPILILVRSRCPFKPPFRDKLISHSECKFLGAAAHFSSLGLEDVIDAQIPRLKCYAAHLIPQRP